MDNITTILAAFNAGKLPSQTQINQFTDWFQSYGLAQAKSATESATGGKLSSQGQELVKRVSAILSAYQALGNNKNGDDLIQEVFWHLSQGDIAASVDVSAPDAPMDVEEATNDVKAVQKALRGLVQIVWSSLTAESSELFSDFSSFARLTLADAAELLEEQASRTKTSLRETEDEVKQGKRDVIGRDKERLKEEEDVKVQFEHGMDTLKGVGVTAIGTGQEASAKAEEIASNTSSRLQAAFDKFYERVQNDSDYNKSISTLIDIAEKWLTRTEDAVKSTDVDAIFYDPTPEQHLSKAVQGLKTLVERLAGNKSLDDLYSQGRRCAIHIQNDKNLQKWFNEFFSAIRRTLDEPGYVKSDEFKQTKKELRTRWKKFFEDDTQWKKDWDGFKRELLSYESALKEDKDLNNLKDAHAQLGQAIERGLVDVGDKAQTGLQAVMEQASWFWRDVFQVYIPQALNSMKDIPIPRTEYVDEDLELVLENLDISSFGVNPAHVFIRNITDVDIQTSATSAPATSQVGTYTHIRIQAVQLALKDVSFFYKDKKTSVGPSEFSGLLSFVLPPKGIDVDVKLRMIPAQKTAHVTRGKETFEMSERELHHGFHVVEHCQAEVTSDIELSIKQSNHAMLLSVFKPIFTMRFREALERSLSQQISSALKFADGVAWDVSKRSEVFRDTGLGNGGALAAAIWSELGRMKRFGGMEATGTGTGFIVEGEEGQKFAMGAEPQVIAGDKKGPLATASVPLEDRVKDIVGDSDVGASAGDAAGKLKKEGTGVARQAQGALKRGQKQLNTFRDTVEAKSEKEKAKEGWRSSAFDLA